MLDETRVTTPSAVDEPSRRQLPVGYAWEPAMEEIRERADAGDDVTPEVVVSIEGVGDVRRYFNGVLSLRHSGGESFPPWSHHFGDGWPYEALAFGPVPVGSVPLDPAITVVDGVFYGVVRTDTVRLEFEGGLVVRLPELCAGKVHREEPRDA
jgi:hypothetical protein